MQFSMTKKSFKSIQIKYSLKVANIPSKYPEITQNLCFEKLRPQHDFSRSEYEANTLAEAEKKLRSYTNIEVSNNGHL